MSSRLVSTEKSVPADSTQIGIETTIELHHCVLNKISNIIGRLNQLDERLHGEPPTMKDGKEEEEKPTPMGSMSRQHAVAISSDHGMDRIGGILSRIEESV